MNKYLLLCLSGLIILNCGKAMSQRNANIGIFGGVSYYMGDINPNRHLYRPAPSFGALYRYNLNTRFALRGSAYYADLSGSDLDFPEITHPDRPTSPATFNTSLLDLALLVEFNFLPFTPNVGNLSYTPYISTGISGALISGTNASAENLVSFPFGLGVKVNLTKRISTGAEWSFRKTFSDRVDGLENPSGTVTFLHNNDWYSLLGVFITFKFFNFAAECPAYN
jgi:hypothetical protein